jgi:hypothetical protein
MIRFVLLLARNPLALGSILAVIMAMTGGTYGLGRLHGSQASDARYRAEQARLQAVLFETAERLSLIEAERLAAEAEVQELGRKLEDAARDDPEANRPALSADSVRRLNRR